MLDEVLFPQRPQHGDLVVEPFGTVAERRPERRVLDVVPSGSDAQHQAPARQHVHLGGLLGDERRLPLRQHEDAGGELDPGRVSGEEAEQHERLVERVVLRCTDRAGPARGRAWSTPSTWSYAVSRTHPSASAAWA